MAKRKQMPARSVEGRQNQLINLAVKEAERRLQDGTASSQIITTLLKWASTTAELELEKLRNEVALTQAKKKEIDARIENDGLLDKALEAFRSYQGVPYEEDEYDE